ncbi:hypothetical protein [Flavobacterium tructae]|uniref:hypothetical protein n=1 Tax=Flavobacterium tructae TaxID=1114873 RepID=UPI0035A9017F
MYTLYYLNKNLQLGTIKVENLGVPILIPEDLVFCNFRKESIFIKHPHMCIGFSDTERLIIASEFTDMSLLKDYDFRRQNTYLEASCAIGEDGEPEKCNIVVNCECKCECKCDEEPQPPFVGTPIECKGGNRICSIDGYTSIEELTQGVYIAYTKKASLFDLVIGDTIYEDKECTRPFIYPFIQYKGTSGYNDLVGGVITKFYRSISTCIAYRYLSEVQLTGVKGEVITLQYMKANGGTVQDTWTVGGNGEVMYYTFGVGECVKESSVGIDGGTLIQNVWIDSISCPVEFIP